MEEKFAQKPKCRVSLSGVKTITLRKKNIGAPHCEWVERWLEQSCRERGLPLSLVCGDFVAKAGSLMDAKQVIDLLERLRIDFNHYFPETEETTKEEEWDFLKSI
jgi:hypothetical protein